MRYLNLFARLVANTEEPVSDTSCWLAEGTMDPKGYVMVTKRVPGKLFPTKHRGHREMEQLTRGQYNEFDLDDDPLGPILLIERPLLDRDEETIDHLCYVRRCWNPDHLNVTTRVENTKLMQQRKIKT